ncbi:hypothetical protein C0993_009022 [Termitomyces sp. T159_Od127]|nr:hypothetical protein C0993_009022 [Termitomyces sp. T159_Od127]
MLFSVVLLFVSFSAFSSLAAPVPSHVRAKAAYGGWPNSIKAGSSFGISGGFEKSYIGKGPQNEVALIGHYPKGSYAGSKPPGPGISGFIFEASGGPGVNIASAKEARLTYKVRFEDGFDFQLGGKLPGLYGGANADIAKKCTGGYHNNKCWSARLMWRDHGAGELYAYLPTANQKLAVCKGKCDLKYGASIDTGNYKFTPGRWIELSERVKLNDVGKMNGEIEVFQDGASKILIKGIELRGSEEGRIFGAMIHTFFGGSSKPAYASPKDQKAYFKDFRLEVTEKL